MKVSVVNLGCKVNRVESDTIAATYLQNGSTLVNAAEAELIVVNTCTVTEEAEKKTRKTIRKLLRENNSASVLVTGCAATINPDFYCSLDDRIVLVQFYRNDKCRRTSGCCRIIGISIRLYIAIRTTAKYNGSICLTACHGNLGTTDADLSGST